MVSNSSPNQKTVIRLLLNECCCNCLSKEEFDPPYEEFCCLGGTPKEIPSDNWCEYWEHE